MRPLLLDLFCGAGGAAMGYHRAGFDVIGVDIVKRKRYPFPFIQGDALDPPVDLAAFDALHASPPCQAYSVTRHTHTKDHPDLLGPTREMLEASGIPWVIENVPGAPMPAASVACGASFGLKAWDEPAGEVLWLKRHRLFESNAILITLPECNCRGKRIGGVYGGGPSNRNNHDQHFRGGCTPAVSTRRELMGIGWTSSAELSQAIPPAYTEHIGRQLIEAL